MTTQTMTLGAFIQSEIERRHMTTPEFARYANLSISSVKKYLNYGVIDVYGGQPIGDPSLDFLARLAIATNTDVAYLVGLVKPNATKGDLARAGLQQILAQLSDSDLEVVEGYARLLVEKRTREPG